MDNLGLWINYAFEPVIYCYIISSYGNSPASLTLQKMYIKEFSITQQTLSSNVIIMNGQMHQKRYEYKKRAEVFW